MINLLVGLQGSGKSYYAVAEIWKHIKKMHQAEISGSSYKYTKIYTNIEGFIPNRYVETLDVARLQAIWEWELKQYLAYEKRHQYELPADIEFPTRTENKKKIVTKAKPVIEVDIDEIRVEESTVDNIEVFDNNDTKLFESIKDPDATLDPEFIQYTLPKFEAEGFTNCLIVVDEAHNFFGARLSPAFKRLLSYHRHYHDQDYLLISQDHKMFNFAVCQLAAYSIRAINPIMRWRSNLFTYNIYSGGWISFSGDNKLETKSLKAKELIFNLYNSGGKVLQKSHFMKVILKLFLGVVFIGGLIFWYLNHTKSHDKVKVTTNKDLHKKEIVKKAEVPEQKTFMRKFLIIGHSIIDVSTGKKFAYDNFKNMLTSDDKPVTLNVNMDGTTTAYYKLSKQTLINLTLRRADDEKNTFGGFTSK
jgi:hypothetical protein